MTTAKTKETARIENWLKTVGIDASKSQDLIEKYGVSNTYKLVQESLMRPHDMAKHLDGTRRSSKNTINYLLDNTLSPEEISAVTKTDLDQVKSDMPQKPKIEVVERPEAPEVTIGNTEIVTSQPVVQEQTQTKEDERAQTKAALIDQAQASVSPDEEKRNPMAEAQNALFDAKIAQRHTATTENASVTPLSRADIVYKENYDWVASKIKEELAGPAISAALSPEEQKEALIQQYATLRKEHYDVLCYNSGLDMYTSSKAICDCYGRNAMNKCIWSGCEGISTDIVPADSTARMATQLITDKNTQRDLKGMGAASCAITGATIVHNICQKMEFENGATFTPPSDKGSQYRSAAGHFNKMDSQTSGYTGSGTMKDLIASGKIGPGDRFSTKTNGDTESGYHLRTIIAVNKNDKGEITGYIVQGNNNLELSYHNINDKNDPFNYRAVKYSSTSQWAQTQINQECTNMKDLSFEEIQAKIEKEKEAIASTVINSVQIQEARLSELQGIETTPQYAEKYPILYSANIAGDKLITPMPQLDTLAAYKEIPYTFEPLKAPENTTSREELKSELLAMTGTEVYSAEIYFRNRKFEKHVDAHAEAKSKEKTRRPRRIRSNYDIQALWNTHSEL